MNSEKYIGLDVHQATISVAVLDSTGKLVMESILETRAATILEFFAGLRGTLSVTFDVGTWAAWLYDLLKPHVAKRDRRAHAARASPELPDHRQRSDPSHVSVESGLSQLGHPLCRPGLLLSSSSNRVAGQDQGSRRPSPSRTTL